MMDNAPGMQKLNEPHQRVRRRRYDAALLLPLIGAAALMPPFANLFATTGAVFGIPSAIVYLFGVWFGLIIAARALSRKLMAPEPPAQK